MPEDINNKPLTIKDIRETLIPAMEEVFATKKDLKIFKAGVREDMKELKDELKEEMTEKFDKVLVLADKVVKDLETLTTEKIVGDYQQKKQRQLWAIVIEALREHKILSPGQLEQIKELEIL